MLQNKEPITRVGTDCHQIQSGRKEAPPSTLQKVCMFSATLQIFSVFCATNKVRQISLRQESCAEHIDSQQLSCLMHICLTLIVAQNTLIIRNVALKLK